MCQDQKHSWRTQGRKFELNFSPWEKKKWRGGDIWCSSTGIPSPPLALFIVMLSKAHLTSHSRMSGSRSMITPSWLSGWWRSFLYSSSVYSCHLFLISSASFRSIPFLSFIVPIIQHGKILQNTSLLLEKPE